MSQPLVRIHNPSSSYSYSWRPLFPSPSHNNIPSHSSSLFLTSPTLAPSPISIFFRGIRGPIIPSLKGSLHQELVDFDSPISVGLQPISGDSQLDQLIAHTQHPLIIVWMANWCRSCIYLKPKLEKLAVEYYPRLQFYSVDVNTVSHKLVARAGVTKMPTIQLWKDGKKQAEVIGSRKAHWIIDDVQEMIENECPM